MVNRFVQLLKILFPPRADQLTVSQHKNTSILYQPAITNGVWHITAYHKPMVKAAILENKFYRNVAAAEILTNLLQQFIEEKQLEGALLIPIPLHKKRQRERGYNQTTLLLQCLSSQTQVNLRLLNRVRDTVPQMKLTRSKRLINLKKAFAVNLTSVQELQQYSTIILIDDVVTTGTTLLEAQATLSPHFPTARIICLAIAH